MKRFYTDVTRQESSNGFYILLDGKPIKTPTQAPLVTPHSRIAETIREEWAAQVETINPNTMPITQWVITQIDRVSPQREKLQGEILGYIDTDLLCYRAHSETPIGQLQSAAWDPILNWVQESYGVYPITTTSLEPIEQPAALHTILRKYAQSLSDPVFTALYILTCETGSLFLGLASIKIAFSEEEIFAAARVEEEYKKQLYHEDKHGSAPDQEKREARLRQEISSARHYLALIDDKPV